MYTIKFGTDGWRAVIAEGYTFDNLERVARATGQWVLRRTPENPSAVVGYDTRFQGAAFARRTAEVLASMGLRVQLADHFVPTPAVSWATKQYGHAVGVVITASHNPPEYSGFKLKLPFGGPAHPAMVAEVEEELGRLGEPAELRSFEALEREGRVETINLQEAYRHVLRDRLDIEAIRASGLKVGCDPMYGAGQGTVTDLLGRERVVEVHDAHNPGMHGQPPEPIERNLEYLSRLVVEERCDVGLAFDGDADRIGMMDAEGRFVDSHKILALLVKYLHEEKGLDGTVVKTFSTSDMLDRMGQHYGLPVETTPIGFKYIAPMIVEGDVLVGGEESGGIAVKGHLPERDGIYIGLTIVEMMVKRDRSLAELVEELQDAFGPLEYARNDLHTTEEKKQRFLRRLDQEGLREIAGRPVRRVEDLDGFKFRLDDGWLMFRPSGTEPVLRIYAEAPTEQDARDLVAAGVALVEG
ncbi:MAG: phosphoglucomutase/phosphomannomutase family protein [Rhodothermales bacterium]|nr:phosphoglucomutase/phosphomannomutase family protein [Rhodothermales bacterium]